jgi:hypothetical protein
MRYGLVDPASDQIRVSKALATRTSAVHLPAAAAAKAFQHVSLADSVLSHNAALAYADYRFSYIA